MSRATGLRVEIEVRRPGSTELDLAGAAGAGIDLGAAFGDPRVRRIAVTLGEPFEEVVPVSALVEHLETLSPDDPCQGELTRPGTYLIHRVLGVRGVTYRFVGKRGAPVPLDDELRGRIGLVTPLAGVLPLEDGIEIGFPILVGAQYAHIELGLGFAGDPYSVAETASADLPRGAGLTGRSAASDIPRFPWPPPRASATDILPVRLLKTEGALPASLGQVDERLTEALEATGYFERGYYAVPGGFALATRLEQIEDDGSPKPPPDRWSTETPRMSEFSLSAYLRALFFAPHGRYRVIVLVVTAVPFGQREATVSAGTAESWLVEGLNRLPRTIAEIDFEEDVAVTALIYEFEWLDTADAPDPVPSSQLQGRDHLRKTGILEALRP